MKHFILFLHRVTTNPYVAVASAILVISVAAYEFRDLPPRGHPDGSGYLALALVGLMVLIRALADIFESVEDIEEAFGKDDSGRSQKSILLVLRRFTTSPSFELFTALLILLAGFFQAYSAWKLKLMSQMWHWGIVILALSLMTRSLSALLGTVTHAERSINSLHRCFSFVHRANQSLRKPFIEVTIGLLLMLLVIWEEPHRMHHAEEMMIRGYFGIFLLGLLRIGQFLPNVFKGIELLAEAEEKV